MTTYTKHIQELRTDENGNSSVVNVEVEMTEDEYNELHSMTPSQEQEMRLQRNLRLSACDWSQGEDVPDFIKLPYKTYRQALRDITSHANWPDLTRDDWPAKPQI
jgi:hypothetical protein